MTAFGRARHPLVTFATATAVKAHQLLHRTSASADGIDINTVGIILMIAGAIGLLPSLLFWSSAAPWGAGRRTVVREDETL
jgi:hypothetical protein